MPPLHVVPTPPITPQFPDNVTKSCAKTDIHQKSRHLLAITTPPLHQAITSRTRPPHMIWNKTINDLDSTVARVGAIQTTTNRHKNQLRGAQTKLNQLLTRTKDIEKSRLGVDWDAVVESGKLVPPPVLQYKGEDETGRIMTRHDIQSVALQERQAFEAQAKAVALAKATFNDSSQKYIEEFISRTQEHFKASKAEVEEHDAVLKDIQAISKQVVTLEKVLSDRSMRYEEEWVTILANLAVDNGVPPLVRAENLLNEGTMTSQETTDSQASESGVSGKAPRLIIKLKIGAGSGPKPFAAGKDSKDQGEKDNLIESGLSIAADADLEVHRGTRARRLSSRKKAGKNSG